MCRSVCDEPFQARGVFDLPVGEDPEDVHAVHSGHKGQTLLIGHAKQRGGKGVRQGAVPGDDGQG